MSFEDISTHYCVQLKLTIDKKEEQKQNKDLWS